MENKPKFHQNPNLKLMDQVREVLRYHHYAYRTEQTSPTQGSRGRPPSAALEAFTGKSPFSNGRLPIHLT